jgi:hypothetical protein
MCRDRKKYCLFGNPVSADADCVAGFVGVVDDEAADGDGHGRCGMAGFTGPLVAAAL